MARCGAQETIPLQRLRACLSHARAKRGGADPALLLAAALRERMRRMGPPGTGRGHEQPLLAQYRSYVIQIGRRQVSWHLVRPLLRQALEADLPPERRSQAARDLAAFLHAERPTRVQYALARPLLVELWQNLNRN
ncbi:hypothetical protein [Meiothermus phage MMP17]|nr:valine--tRNA ligase [Meiothermus phage MMP7]QAY18076.1 hypothetical protein [Meiothermus phage MMP17]